MSQKNERSITEGQQTRAYAGYYGMWVGTSWIMCFALSIWGLTAPLAGNIGLLIGFCSLPLAIRLMRGFRDNIAPLPLRRAWHMSWLIFMAAAMLTTAAQYIYFAYLDDGLLMRTYSELIQQPEVHQTVEQLFPDQDIDALTNEMVTTFSATSPSQLALSFLFWNAVLGTIMAFPAALFSFSRPTSNK